MKRLLLLTAIMTLSTASHAIEYQKILYNYIVPCTASIAVGSLLDSENGQRMGITVCTGVSAFAAMQEFSPSKEATAGDLELATKNIKKHNEAVVAEAMAQLNAKMDALSGERRVILEQIRSMVSSAVTDQSLFMSEQMAERLKSAMTSPDFIPDLMEKINSRVKAEVASEYELRRSRVIRETVDEVIRQVTARPVEVPRQAPRVKKVEKKEDSKYEDEE